MTKEEQARLQKEHEAKYMKYMADFESFGGDFSSCSGNCSSCSSTCDSKNQKKAENDTKQVDGKTPKKAQRIVAIFSGKGGTGKSVATCLLADKLQKMGKKVAVPGRGFGESLHSLSLRQAGALQLRLRAGSIPMTADSGVQFISMGNVGKGRLPSPLTQLWQGHCRGRAVFLPQCEMAGGSGLYAGGYALRRGRCTPADWHDPSLRRRSLYFQPARISATSWR